MPSVVREIMIIQKNRRGSYVITELQRVSNVNLQLQIASHIMRFIKWGIEGEGHRVHDTPQSSDIFRKKTRFFEF